MALTVSEISSIGGSISIACWIVVFTPQILENFTRRSTEGLSAAFVMIWLTGDVFNIIGAVMQGVLPTMIILAVYYAFCDVLMLSQIWWYRRNGSGVGTKRAVDGGVVEQENQSEDDERRPLRGDPICINNIDDRESKLSGAAVVLNGKHRPILQRVAIDFAAVVVVCSVGVFGWWLSNTSSSNGDKHESDHLRGTLPQFNIIGQIFGYLCSMFYLGSRIPQLLLNYQRKSTEGVSLLFFMFACLGNLTYNVSIFAFDPSPYCKHGPDGCASGEGGEIYARHIAVTASWILGSLGTMLLDVVMFVQFFLYRKRDGGVLQNRAADYGSLSPEAERRPGSETR